eukprot:6471101-Prymnesium_polylepis.1
MLRRMKNLKETPRVEVTSFRLTNWSRPRMSKNSSRLKQSLSICSRMQATSIKALWYAPRRGCRKSFRTRCTQSAWR